MRIQNVAGVLCLLFASVNAASVFAAEITVYRWIDENNIVHFSQHQPAHDNYTEITMVEALKAKAKIVKATEEVEEPTKTAKPSGAVRDRFNRKCEEARANVRTLETFDKIQTTGDDGKTRMLTQVEKSQQLELSKKQVEVYCESFK